MTIKTIRSPGGKFARIQNFEGERSASCSDLLHFGRRTLVSIGYVKIKQINTSMKYKHYQTLLWSLKCTERLSFHR